MPEFVNLMALHDWPMPEFVMIDRLSSFSLLLLVPESAGLHHEREQVVPDTSAIMFLHQVWCLGESLCGSNTVLNACKHWALVPCIEN